ncbi:MAG TPA: ribokinase [Clostridiales bacterium]|nr:ribokinase [Clostridiales bacterium]
MKKILVVGSLNIDFVINVDEMPKTGETVLGNNLEFIPGGKGANQAYAAGKLGASIAMIGAVGRDIYGTILVDNLTSVGVDTTAIARLDNQKTGSAFIVVNKQGHNRIIVISGANKCISIDIINRHINMIQESDIIIMQLEIPMDVVIYVAKIAKQMGKLVILDPAPAPEFLPDELIQNVDILKPNETELARLTGCSIYTIEDIVSGANKLVNRGVPTVIVTLGERGAVMVNRDGWVHKTVSSVKAVDTTAAGDGFIAALALGLTREMSIDEAIDFGNSVSTLVVTRKGAQTSIPTMDEVKLLLKHI